MYKKQYSERSVMLRAAILVHDAFPDCTENEKMDLKNSEEWRENARLSLISEDFIDKVAKMYENYVGYMIGRNIAIEIMNKLPLELMPNVEEWLDDKPISDIKIHGISLTDIMGQFPNRKIDFLDALKCICRWAELGYQEDFCRLYFARM